MSHRGANEPIQMQGQLSQNQRIPVTPVLKMLNNQYFEGTWLDD